MAFLPRKHRSSRATGAVPALHLSSVHVCPHSLLSSLLAIPMEICQSSSQTVTPTSRNALLPSSAALPFETETNIQILLYLGIAMRETTPFTKQISTRDSGKETEVTS